MTGSSYPAAVPAAICSCRYLRMYFGVPALRNVVNGAAGLGSAICAATATGVYDTFDAAIENMVRVKDTFYPNEANTAIYTEMNQKVYEQITSATDDILEKAYPILAIRRKKEKHSHVLNKGTDSRKACGTGR